MSWGNTIKLFHLPSASGIPIQTYESSNETLMWHVKATGAYISVKIYKGRQPVIPAALLNVICNYWIQSPDSILYVGCNKGDIDSVRWALEHGAEPQGFRKRKMLTEDITLLHLCVSKGHVEIAKLLIEQDNNIVHERFEYDGGSCLQLAATKDDIEMCELLISYDCDVNRSDKLGRTALMEAAAIGSYKIINILLNNNADPNARDKAHSSAISYCLDDCNDGDFLKTAVNLIDHEADSHQIGKETERTLLHYAAAQGDVELTKKLIKSMKPHIKPIDVDGKTPLDYAREYKRDDIIECFNQSNDRCLVM